MGRSMFKFAVVAIAIVAAFAAIWLYAIKPKLETEKGYLELTQADEWGDLQGIEFQHRKMLGLRVPVLLKAAVGPKNYDVLGVRSDNNNFPYVWIVLNVNAGANGIFSMPHDEAYTLPCAYLRDIESKESIDLKVKRALEAHCTEFVPSGGVTR